MPAFKDIVGHEQIIEHLQNAITMDKVSHAYILNGPDKSGKMMIAEAFAQTLQCEAVNKKLEELAGETESERIENKFTAARSPVRNVIPVSRRCRTINRILSMSAMRSRIRFR